MAIVFIFHLFWIDSSVKAELWSSIWQLIQLKQGYFMRR